MDSPNGTQWLDPRRTRGAHRGKTINARGPNAALLPPPTEGLIGVDLQGYVICRRVSSGGMGVVYEARHALIGHRVAVKVLRPEYSSDEDLKRRFLGEARAISAIKHRNVVEIVNFGLLPDGGPYLMMEFLEGESLHQLCERSGPLAVTHVLGLAEEILSGLAAAHQVGVVHRDLKPANVMLSMQAQDDLLVKVCDFGLARQFDVSPEAASAGSLRAERGRHASLIAGTPEYISPEQAAGDPVDGQADLYSLGVMLFEMLSGRLPFEAATALELLHLHRTAAPPSVASLVVGIPPVVGALVQLLLSKDPARRPPGAKAAREIVRRLRDVAPCQSWPSPPGPTFRALPRNGLDDTLPSLRRSA